MKEMYFRKVDAGRLSGSRNIVSRQEDTRQKAREGFMMNDGKRPLRYTPCRLVRWQCGDVPDGFFISSLCHIGL